MNVCFNMKGKPVASYTLEIDEHGSYAIRSGDGYEEDLGADEALYLMARIIMTDGAVHLRTREEHLRHWARMFGPASILEPWQKQLTAVQGKVNA